jgi:hypothetical protein
MMKNQWSRTLCETFDIYTTGTVNRDGGTRANHQQRQCKQLLWGRRHQGRVWPFAFPLEIF